MAPKVLINQSTVIQVSDNMALITEALHWNQSHINNTRAFSMKYLYSQPINILLLDKRTVSPLQ